MREKGRVVRIENGFAIVQMTRSAACNCCGMCNGLVPGSNELHIRTANAAGASPGDTVEIEVQTRGVLQAAFLVYGLPLLGGIAGFILGSLVAGGIYRIAGALLGFGIAFPVIYFVDKRAAREERFLPEIVGIERD